MAYIFKKQLEVSDRIYLLKSTKFPFWLYVWYIKNVQNNSSFILAVEFVQFFQKLAAMGPFMYYVSMFPDIFWPPHYVLK